MNNKTKSLYDIIFKSIIRFITQNDNLEIKLKSITSDSELGLLNAINNNFHGINRINCFYHYKRI